MKIFIVADIHGNAEILKAALAESGFDPNNPNHLLIACGDQGDRGAQSKEVYDYLDSIRNKVIIRGNHEEMLMEAIERGYIRVDDVYNGTQVTIEDLVGQGCIDSRGKIHISDYRKKQILDCLSQTVDYYETQNYVFVHGWIPEENYFTGDWRNATAAGWSDARWVGWTEMHNKFSAAGKIIVCGHSASKYAAAFDSSRAADDYSPYFGKNFIAIDSNTVKSQIINVLVLEDELLPVQKHSMKLKRAFFDKIVRGSKTVEMRLFDEKRKRIKAGDVITFTADDDSGDTVDAKVLGIHVYPSFETLTDDFDTRSLGFERRKADFVCEYMKRFYDDDSVRREGVAAIRIQKIKQKETV